MLRAEGISGAYVVTHGWHMPRALDAFARHRLETVAAPVRLAQVAGGRVAHFLPRADHLADSWWAIREWVARAFYAVRT